MVEMTSFGHSRLQSSEVSGGSVLAAARISPGAAQTQVASSHGDVQLRGAKTPPELLTSLTALPAFVSLVPVRLPFPPLPPRTPKGPASADTNASTGSGAPGLPLHKQSGRHVPSRDMRDNKIRLSCGAWLQTPTSRRLFTGGQLRQHHASL